jgi:hypothetical protein
VDIGKFGHCWHPNAVAVGWRPYCVGQWEWTDCGWYWQSSEPWSWACYHYGSWVLDPTYGWVWVPAVEWAPAWVVWRESDAYIGWAPCAPAGITVAPTVFAFVPAPQFCDPIRPSVVIVNNTRIIEQTRVVNNVTRETRTIEGATRPVIVNQGPRVDLVQRATHRSLQAVPVREVVQRTPTPKNITATANERQRVLQEPAQNRPTRETPPIVQSQSQQLKDLRPAPSPNRPKTPATEPPTGRQPERVYPREPNRPPVTPQGQQTKPPAEKQPERVYPREAKRPPVIERPSSVPTQPIKPPAAQTGREQNRVYGPPPANPPTQRVAPTQPRPVTPPPPPTGPAPEQKEREREGR